MASLLSSLVTSILIIARVYGLRNDTSGPLCPYSEFTPSHTLCQFRGSDPNCVIAHSGVSVGEIKVIMALHNLLRSSLAIGGTNLPNARNMKQLYWDDELAMIAQRWADQCRDEHDCNRCRQVSRFLVGQNRYLQVTDKNLEANWLGSKWTEIITKWYQQITKFNPSQIRNYAFDDRTGDFSQLVWAETSRIGCGYTEFMANNKRKQLYICNYGPAGNVLFENIYESGDSCTKCDGSCSPIYNGLCDSSKPKKRLRLSSRYNVATEHSHHRQQSNVSCSLASDEEHCTITTVGNVIWTRRDDGPNGSSYLSSDVQRGMSTDVVVKMKASTTKKYPSCISVSYRKFASSEQTSSSDQPIKIVILTADDKIESTSYQKDTTEWKELTTLIESSSSQITVMIHFDVAAIISNKIGDDSEKMSVRLDVGDINLKPGKC